MDVKDSARAHANTVKIRSHDPICFFACDWHICNAVHQHGRASYLHVLDRLVSQRRLDVLGSYICVAARVTFIALITLSSRRAVKHASVCIVSHTLPICSVVFTVSRICS